MASKLCGLALCAAGLSGLAIGSLATAGGPQFVFTGPTAYSSVADSPFFGGPNNKVGVTYFLEDFEDGSINTPGLNIDPGAVIVNNASADIDDGKLDGIGLGKRLRNNQIGVITLQFTPGPLGGYPTKVGIVWTSGAANTAVTVTVIGAGAEFASQPFFPVGQDVGLNDTSDDRFLGVTFAGGIQQVQIADSAGTLSIDHIQYDSPTPSTLYVRDFINNDVKSDLVWHNQATGGVGIWFMDGLTRLGGGPPSQAANANWVPQGLGDLDGDGKADIVWRDPATNFLHVWLMNGQTVLTSSQVQNANAVGGALQVIAVCDVNGDKKADIVFRNTNTGALNAWIMDGVTRTSGGAIAGINTTGYTYAGAGDLNGDGRFDLVFREDASGVVWGLLMNSLTPIVFQAVGNANPIPTFWSLQAAGDLDGDGKADLIWRNLNTGVVNGWLMDGLWRRTGGQMGTIPLNWTLRAAADMSGDGKADLVWTNPDEQKVNGWLMDGLTRTAGGTIQTLSPAWNLVNR